MCFATIALMFLSTECVASSISRWLARGRSAENELKLSLSMEWENARNSKGKWRIPEVLGGDVPRGIAENELKLSLSME